MIGYCKRISKRDFITKTEVASRRKRRKREYLNKPKTGEILGELNRFFESRVEMKRARAMFFMVCI